MADTTAFHGDLDGDTWAAMPDKQEQILDAALSVFREKGFHEAKVEEIAGLAGVGKGTIYEYFDTKTDLFQQTVKYHLFKFWRFAQHHVDAGSSAKDKIRRVIESESRLLGEDNSVRYLLLQDPGPVNIDLKKWMWEQRASIILDSIEGIVRQGVKDGELRAVDTRVAACFIFMAFHAFLALHVLSPGRSTGSRERDVESTLDLLLHGMAR